MDNNTPTHTKRRLQEANQLRVSICVLLNWSIEQFNTYQYEAGIDYLKHYLPNDTQGAHMLEGSRIFWNWWRNHWGNRDNSFIRACIDWVAPAATYEMAYKELNDPVTLATAIYPNGMIVNESEKALIRDLFTAKTEAI